MSQTTRLYPEATPGPFYPAGLPHFITNATNYDCLLWVIEGFFFMPVAGIYPAVDIGGTPATVIFATDTIIFAMQGAGTPTGPQTITVTNSLGFSDTIVAAVCTPSATKISYVSSYRSDNIVTWTIYGRGLCGLSSPVVTVGADTATILTFAADRIQCTTPFSTSDSILTVTNADTMESATVPVSTVEPAQYRNARTIRATNVFNTAIAPPADITINPGDPVTQLYVTDQRLYSYLNTRAENRNGRIAIRKAGVYCSCPGLILNTIDARIDLDVTFINGYFLSTLSGFLGYGTGSKIVTGLSTLFTTELAAGDYMIAGQSPADSRPVLMQVDTIIDDTTLTIKNYPPVTNVSCCGRLAVQDSHTFNLYGVNRLNTLYEFSQMSPVGEIFQPYTGELYFIAGISLTSPLSFSTKNVNAAFSGKEIALDVMVEMEYLPWTN